MTRTGHSWLTVALAALGAGALAACTRPPPTPFLAGSLPKSAPGTGQQEVELVKAPVKPGAINQIDITTLFPLQQAGAVVLFDTRPAIFYHMGRIPGARSWPAKRFEAQLAENKPLLASATGARMPVVLYCTDRDCADAHAVAERIAALGYSVAVLEGGFEEWKAAGLPTQ